jgi:integrase
MASVSIRRRATKRGPRFQVRFRLGGRAYPVQHGGSFSTLKEARTRQGLIAGELAAGRNPADLLRAMVDKPQVRRFREWAEAYKASRVDLVDTSNIEHHLKRMDALGDRDPATITVADVQEWIGANADMKASSLSRYIATLRLVLDFANVDPNPARDRRVKLPKIDQEEEPQPPTAKQFLALVDHSPHSRRLALVAMEQTAMAVGETSKLAWGDVDVAESKFRLRRSTVKGRNRTRARWVQVPRWLMDVIEDTCPLDDRTADRLVFGGTPDIYRNVMARASRAAGTALYSPHDLRHRRLSLWHGQGVTAAELAKRAGHSKPSMSLDVYSHVMPLDEASSEQLSALIES